MTDTTIEQQLAKMADDPDELAEILEHVDPAVLERAHAEAQQYQLTIEAAIVGRWLSPLPEPPDLTRLEFESGKDIYAFWRDDSSSAIAGYGYGPGARTWMEYGRTVPVSWHVLCATYGVEELEGAVRLLVHPEDAHKLAARPSFRYTLEVLAEHSAAERQAHAAAADVA